MQKHLTMKVHGTVQGVGYRIAAYWTARKMHIGGFVMNEPEGNVYIEAEGEQEDLNKFLTWCEKGPVTASVTKVEPTWSEPTGKFTGFRIG